MSISTKGRRRITVGDKVYIWYVAFDDDTRCNVLNVVSDDKYLILTCPLQTKPAYLISKGRIFQSKETDGLWNRYLLPFDVPEAVTPKFVEKLILWAVRDPDAVSVNVEDVPV